MDVTKLKDFIEGKVFADAETLDEVKGDFGRIIEKFPAVLAVPSSASDVQRIVELANQEGWHVAIRGAAHSQSGQSLSQGGIVLDLGALNEIDAVEGDTVWCEAGVVWADLAKRTLAQGKLPRVLTNNLNVTVGGTLSMAGLGVASHRFGTQADNVTELEVVTGEGHLLRCSKEENSQLFDCTRCGLGQFSVITGARIRLRDVPPGVRTYYLLYDDLSTLMRDQELIIKGDRADYIESWCAPCPQGFRKVGEAKLPFAEWFYPMQLTVEFDDSQPDDASVLSGLNFYRHVHTEDGSIAEFVHRLDPVFRMWRESGAWQLAHPWMECVLPWPATAGYIQGVLDGFPPNLLIGGHVLLWPCRGTTSDAPLFMHPKGEFVMGFGILPAVPQKLLPLTLPMLNKASDLSIQVGGKRYLSGWVEFDQARWRNHFGELWPKVREWKGFYDPNGVLNPGFIDYSRT